ncbi:lycopene cyclase domain-containing protein [Curtobacterium sp. MCBA15_001]|uniref:lycopene cyclase domain-containing protein n=1 Tax=Curtobacterium sp. MCBA15_001 TaxID=1898731 RepID=UPI0008DE57E2|nr:lycopene cyclase domain-containing protein [Curtobacterium sp. MCBA15_001]OIH95183.1 hypothetical protein BIU90_03350 [Curtobacterium sp. MCBA15_001]
MNSGLYAALAVPFLAVAVLTAVAAGIVAARRSGPSAPGGSRARAVSGRRIALIAGIVAGIALLVMTVVFNNVIVTLGIVAYDPARISGIRVGAFPIEDLAYAIAAAFLLPALWVLFDRAGGRDQTAGRDRVAATGTRHATQPPTRPEDPR